MVYKGVQGCTNVCIGVQRCAVVHKGVQGSTKVCSGAQRCAGVYKGVQWCRCDGKISMWLKKYVCVHVCKRKIHDVSTQVRWAGHPSLHITQSQSLCQSHCGLFNYLLGRRKGEGERE